MSTNISCHICNSNDIKQIKAPQNFSQVTSDCRPWNSKLKMVICSNCGVVQKLINSDWVEDTKKIYDEYQVYAQGSGNEQLIFDSTIGYSIPRSEKIVVWLNNEINLPQSGKLIDIGCGNGSFLKQFNNKNSEWLLNGLELDNRNEKIINSIPNTELKVCELSEIKEEYDLVVLIHALEHIIDPLTFLKKIKSILKKTGFIFIEIPNLKMAPFDILIADHCSHFTVETLEILLNKAGFVINKISEDFIPKEITLIASVKEEISLKDIDISLGMDLVTGYFLNLDEIFKQAKLISGNFGVFGTSISATWLASEFLERVDFFVDEDINRIGGNYMGKPVYGIENCPSNTNVLMPLRYDIASKVIDRLRENCKINFIIPPKTNYNGK